MKKQPFIRIGYFLVSVFCLLGVIDYGAAENQPVTITILHTNDLHAQFIPTPAEWVKRNPKPEIGGMAALKAYVDREKNDATLILDAGDTQTGTLLSNIEIDGALGGGFIQMMNQIGYSASVIGNHEFDNGWENFLKLSRLARFDWLSANLWNGDHLLTERGFGIYQVAGLKIGVIGLTIAPLAGLVSKESLGPVQVKPGIETAQKIIDRIDPETDCIVMLTHQGFKEDSLLAEKIHGADIIVGGHSHTVLMHPHRVKGVIIVQAGARCRYLGRLDVTVIADTVSSYKGRLIPLWVDSIRVDQEMAKMVDAYAKQIDEEYGRQIGTLQADWLRNLNGESNIGNYIADVIRKEARTDFALLNSGGIRKDLPAGPIRVRDIHELLPFQNQIVRFQCSGQDLIQLIRTNAENAVQRNGEILQVSGINSSCKIEPDGKIKFVQAVVNGKPIIPDAMYTGASVDYVAKDNALRYMGFVPSEIHQTYSKLTDAVVQTIREHPNVESHVDGRITLIR